MTLRTLLFDLDGTLLPFDQEAFLHEYFRALASLFVPYMDPKRLVDEVWRATKTVLANEDPALTNLEVFKRSFFVATGLDEREIWPLFEQFYTEHFQELRHLTNPTPISREICRTALAKGYRLVVATNPVFPAVATQSRLEWAGLGDIPFACVTTMEIMHFCKPNPKYYMEILDKIGEEAHRCLMIGNDVQEDGVAGLLGMQTFLVTDCLIDRGVGYLEFDHRGTLAELLTFVERLPSIAQA